MFNNTENNEKAEEKVKKDEQEQEGSDDEDPEVEKEVVGNWKLVDLTKIEPVTGEENDEEIAKFRSKVYRFRNKQWKERGVGELKFLKNKTTKFIRILVRADKTHKCIMNHLIQFKEILCKLSPLKTSKNSWTWAAYDVSDEQPAIQNFCAKFTSEADYQKFAAEFKKAGEENEVLYAEQKKTQEEKQKTEKPTEQAK